MGVKIDSKFRRRDILGLTLPVGGALLLPSLPAVAQPRTILGPNEVATDLLPAGPSLRAGELKIGNFRLNDASSGSARAVQFSPSHWPYIRVEAHTGESAKWDHGPATFVDRAEVVANDPDERIPYGQTFTQAFRMYLDPSTDRTGEWCVIWQHHQTGAHPTIKTGVNPPFAFVWATGTPGLTIYARTAKTDMMEHGFIKPQVVYHDADYPVGIWLHWRLIARYDWQGNALLHIWRDDVQVAKLDGPDFRLGYEWDAAPDLGAYAQFGVYRASARPGTPWNHAQSNPMIIHFSDFTMKRL